MRPVGIGDTSVSRMHAEIEFHAGRFTLVDRSSNGTYVIRDDGLQLGVHRDVEAEDSLGRYDVGACQSFLGIKFAIKEMSGETCLGVFLNEMGK